MSVALTPAGLSRSLLALSIAALVPLPALASAAGGTTVDLSGIASTVVTVIGAAALWLGRAVISVLVSHIQQRTRLDLDEHVRDYLDRALLQAVAYAETRIDEAADASLSAVDLHNRTLALAVNYALDRVPDALAHFGITAAALTTMVEARMARTFGSVILQNDDGHTVFQDGSAGAPAVG
ncbi:hypothetical protein [Azospirillum agricola]|uniref:hypothetical protein n=1 Tax=Azospirillum agricola TaxID=1720247 RepID=UPI000A0F2E9C|nr:hypothetical protein [Azospirillum agricola]SMH62856.1 hypothetical protein SAMN02982994_6679 [Azospirillum lipoferum]